MSYRDTLLAHLVDYKKMTLGISQPGTFHYDGRDVERDHILPKQALWSNLLEPARLLVRDYMEAHPRLRLHPYFHHLNSSQAFAFNLFFPYFEGGDQAAATLLRALGQHGNLVNWEPEAIPHSHEGTHLDALWTTSEPLTTLCEVKLSEADYGKVDGDERRMLKLGDYYRPVLEQHLIEEALEAVTFFESYQVYRNIWHLVHTCPSPGRLLFLLPRANADLWSALDRALAMIRTDTRKRIEVLSVEELLTRLAADNSAPTNLRGYPELLGNKYKIIEGTY
jgi:hypothetical protein